MRKKGDPRRKQEKVIKRKKTGEKLKESKLVKLIKFGINSVFNLMHNYDGHHHSRL